jgi:hypothetical protein
MYGFVDLNVGSGSNSAVARLCAGGRLLRVRLAKRALCLCTRNAALLSVGAFMW